MCFKTPVHKLPANHPHLADENVEQLEREFDDNLRRRERELDDALDALEVE